MNWGLVILTLVIFGIVKAAPTPQENTTSTLDKQVVIVNGNNGPTAGEERILNAMKEHNRELRGIMIGVYIAVLIILIVLAVIVEMVLKMSSHINKLSNPAPNPVPIPAPVLTPVNSPRRFSPKRPNVPARPQPRSNLPAHPGSLESFPQE
jgi:hypothetical protein